MIGALKEKLKRYLLRNHPAWLAAYDYYAKHDLKESWGGPFNGQAGRVQIFQELISKLEFQTIIETGTFRGTTTEFLAKESGLMVYTVEAEPRFYYFARLRLRGHSNVRVKFGDSRVFLEKLGRDPAVPKNGVFFYLDSHWQEDLPLKEEIGLITKFWRGVAIMIDDFQVPGDPGYLYDEYGPGKQLCLEYLQPLSSAGLTPFFPTLPSERETGRKRGCVVLADRGLLERLMKVDSLRCQTGP
jgi:hypothetical protein